MKSPKQKCFGFFCFSLARATSLNILRNIPRFEERELPSITSSKLAVYSLKYAARSHPQEIPRKNKAKINLHIKIILLIFALNKETQK